MGEVMQMVAAAMPDISVYRLDGFTASFDSAPSSRAPLVGVEGRAGSG